MTFSTIIFYPAYCYCITGSGPGAPIPEFSLAVSYFQGVSETASIISHTLYGLFGVYSGILLSVLLLFLIEMEVVIVSGGYLQDVVTSVV